MSPEKQGVFQLLKEVTFRRIVVVYGSWWERELWCYPCLL
jgi:hypothetical protein